MATGSSWGLSREEATQFVKLQQEQEGNNNSNKNKEHKLQQEQQQVKRKRGGVEEEGSEGSRQHDRSAALCIEAFWQRFAIAISIGAGIAGMRRAGRGGREAGIRVLVQARRRIAASEANAKHRKTQSRLDEASQHGGERCVK